MICCLSLFLFVRLMGSKWKKNSKTDFKGSHLRILHPSRQASCTIHITASIAASFFAATSLKEPEVYNDRCCRSWANDQKRCSTEHCHQLAMNPAPINSMTLSSILAIFSNIFSKRIVDIYKDQPSTQPNLRTHSSYLRTHEDIFTQNISEQFHSEVEKRRSQCHQDLQLGGLSRRTFGNHWTAGMETDLESAQIYADIKLRKETPRHSADKGKQQETTSDYMSFYQCAALKNLIHCMVSSVTSFQSLPKKVLLFDVCSASKSLDTCLYNILYSLCWAFVFFTRIEFCLCSSSSSSSSSGTFVVLPVSPDIFQYHLIRLISPIFHQFFSQYIVSGGVWPRSRVRALELWWTPV